MPSLTAGRALGSRRGFVHRPGVKWSPDDDRCVAARVLFTPSDDWRISGVAATARPRQDEIAASTDCHGRDPLGV
jgi:hypothetical protein